MNRLSQIAGYGLWLLMGLAIWFAFVSPLLSFAESAEARLTQVRLEEDRLIATIERLERQRKGLISEDLSDLIWPATQDGAFDASVQSHLGQLARSKGISLRSVAPMAPPQLPYVKTTALKVEAEAHLDQLVAFVLNIESNHPLLLIDRAVIRRLNRPDPANGQPLMFFQMDVVAPGAETAQ